MRPRVAVDTNLYVSYLIRAESIPGHAVIKAWDQCTMLISEETFDELRTVIARPKFSRYIRPDIVAPFLDQVWAISEIVPIPTPIRACRDPRDDLLISGDTDLLALNPFQRVAILAPSAFLVR